MTRTSRPSPAGKNRLNKAQINEQVTQHWARAMIHLNLGNEDAAVAEGLKALEADRTFKAMPRPQGIVLQRVTAHAQVPQEWAFFAPVYGLYVVNQALFDQFGGQSSLATFGRRIQKLTAPAWIQVPYHDWQFLDEISMNLPNATYDEVLRENGLHPDQEDRDEQEE